MACPALVDSERDVQPPSRDQLLQVDLPRVRSRTISDTCGSSGSSCGWHSKKHIESYWVSLTDKRFINKYIYLYIYNKYLSQQWEEQCLKFPKIPITLLLHLHLRKAPGALRSAYGPGFHWFLKSSGIPSRGYPWSLWLPGFRRMWVVSVKDWFETGLVKSIQELVSLTDIQYQTIAFFGIYWWDVDSFHHQLRVVQIAAMPRTPKSLLIVLL